jgi:hypothetical protein
MSGPALASNGDEMMAVWIEYAVDGNDSFALFSDGQLVSPAAQPQIFFATNSGKAWSQRAAVPTALSQCTPALLGDLFNGSFCLAFKGATSDDIYFATYTSAKGWSHPETLPVGKTSQGPALITDLSGNLPYLRQQRAGRATGDGKHHAIHHAKAQAQGE